MFYDPAQTAYFQTALNRIVGQALQAAHYELEDNPLQHQRGLLRYQKPLSHLGTNVYGFLEWQLLAFAQSPIARFQITLLRNQDIVCRAPTTYAHRAEHSLAWIIWHVFNSRVVPSDETWWEFRTGDELLQALSHAGRLLFAYGIPWLEMHPID